MKRLIQTDYSRVGERIFRGVLPNGLRISVIPKPGYTKSFAMFATEYGGADRRFAYGGELINTPAGVAHYLEHKMFDMPEGDNALAVLAANGAQPNAYTASGITAYYFESTEGFSENLETLLRFVSTPYFTEESVAKEQGIIAQEIRMGEDDPDHVVYDELMRCLYASHPIRDSVAGTVESIQEITPEILYRCHRIFYNPSNMSLSVVGDVEPEAVAELAEKVLSAEPGEVPRRDYGAAESDTPVKNRYVRRMEVSAPQFIFGAKFDRGENGNSLLRQKLVSGLALSCLLDQSSPFYNRLYEKGLLNTDFGCGLEYAASTATFIAGGESRDPEAVFGLAMEEIEKIGKEGFAPGLWRRMEKASYGSRIRALSSFGGLCASMADADFEGYNCLDGFSIMEEVTEEETLDFIRGQFRPERFAMSVILPTGETDNA